MPKSSFSIFRAIVVLTGVLALALFIESGRVETIIASDTGFPYSLAHKYLAFSNGIKDHFDGSVTVTPGGTSSSTQNSDGNTGGSTTPPKPFTIPSKPYTTLIAGDSFIADRLGQVLEQQLSTYADFTLYRRGAYSTGLSRPDYFNWDTEITNLLATDHPNVVVIMFGANDAQDIRFLTGSASIHYGTPEWDEEYKKRIGTFLDILYDHNAMVYWIGMPITEAPTYRAKMEHLDSLYEEVIKNHSNARFVSTWDLLKDAKGNYNAYLPNDAGQMRLARNSDGIHVTEFGAQLMVRGVTTLMSKELTLKIKPAANASSTSE
jgi:uncharacterized protein